MPFLVLWLISPAVARWISIPPHETPTARLSPEQTLRLRRIARRTWRFFETFLGPETHHLPADNFQELPHSVVARRTSPTNIGLAVLSTVAANDLGWIGTGEMLDRLEPTLATVRRLERFRGHLYNWYDTGTLSPLEPRYVSTVDSGNLAAHLMVLRHACLERLDEPVRFAPALDGISDALGLLRESAMAGDVYSERPHVGRGGWSWYTGAAGWMYRAGIEWILGFRLRGTVLHVEPCIPRAWPRYEIVFRYHSSLYKLTVENPRGVMSGVSSIALDGAPLAKREVPLEDDGREHSIVVVLG